MKNCKLTTKIFSGVGILAIFLILIALNFIFGKKPLRLDLTQEKVFTLSENSKKVLSKINSEVTINFYCSRGNNMPVQLKSYADRVEDLLNEYKQAAKGKITLYKFDPMPDSDAEDAAMAEGITGQMLQNGEKVYLSLAISYINKTEILQFLNPNKETMLEYEITSAISKVLKEIKPIVGIMSTLPVFGKDNPNPSFGKPKKIDEWVFLTELKKTFEVREVAMDVKEIPSDITTMIVINPSEISEDSEFSLDQFVLRGGKMVAFLDPLAYSVMEAMQNQAPNPEMNKKLSSTFPNLLSAWGLEFSKEKVVSDPNLATPLRVQNGEARFIGVLSLLKGNFNANDTITSQLQNMLYFFGGAFSGNLKDGLVKETLVSTTANSALMNTYEVQNPEMAARSFKSEDKTLDLAVRVTGKFKTAFPDKAKDGKLTESTKDGFVILIGDTDMIYDQFCVIKQQFLNQIMIQPTNGNLGFAQNCVDTLAGDEDLIGIRSRQVSSRPFTKIKELEVEANKKFQKQIEVAEDKVREAEQKINQLLREDSQKNKNQQQIIMSPQVQEEIKKINLQNAENKKKLKELRKELKKEVSYLENFHKWFNILLVPAIVAIAGIFVALIRRKRSAAK